MVSKAITLEGRSVNTNIHTQPFSAFSSLSLPLPPQCPSQLLLTPLNPSELTSGLSSPRPALNNSPQPPAFPLLCTDDSQSPLLTRNPQAPTCNTSKTFPRTSAFHPGRLPNLLNQQTRKIDAVLALLPILISLIYLQNPTDLFP